MIRMRSTCTVLLLLLATTLLGQQIVKNNLIEINGLQYYSGTDADTANQKLNLVIPSGIKNPPLLIWIGGGAWSYVNRNMEMDLARKLAANGIAVASVGHRLSPATWKDPKLTTGIKHPEHIKDIARATKYLFANAAKYGYSSENFFASGYSSGGHLSALLVMDDQYLLAEGLSKNLFKGVIPIAGTYNIQHYHKVLTDGNNRDFADNHIGSVFGLTEKEFDSASPTQFIANLVTPMLLISENNTFKYTALFEDKLIEQQVKNLEVIHVHRLKHGEFWKELSYATESIHRDIILAFIKRHAVGSNASTGDAH